MKKNYAYRIEQLKKRRFDEIKGIPVFKASFNNTQLPQSLRYAVECMQDLPEEYTRNTLDASDKVRGHLDAGFEQRNIHVTYEYQGSVMTNTHIMVQSDIDLLVLTDDFYGVKFPATAPPPYHENPLQAITDLRIACQEILKKIYVENTDITGTYAINVKIQRPKRSVDVVIANWLDTIEYQNNKDKSYRAVQLFNYKEKKREEDYPLHHIRLVNEKDVRVKGNLRKAIRLLKNLCRDAEPEIDLTGFHNTGICYAIPDTDLFLAPDQSLTLMGVVEKHLENLIKDDYKRENLKNPLRNEVVFGKDEEMLKFLKRLHLELAELITDIGEELKLGPGIRTKNIDYK